MMQSKFSEMFLKIIFIMNVLINTINVYIKHIMKLTLRVKYLLKIYCNSLLRAKLINSIFPFIVISTRFMYYLLFVICKYRF